MRLAVSSGHVEAGLKSNIVLIKTIERRRKIPPQVAQSIITDWDFLIRVEKQLDHFPKQATNSALAPAPTSSATHNSKLWSHHNTTNKHWATLILPTTPHSLHSSYKISTVLQKIFARKNHYSIVFLYFIYQLSISEYPMMFSINITVYPQPIPTDTEN